MELDIELSEAVVLKFASRLHDVQFLQKKRRRSICRLDFRMIKYTNGSIVKLNPAIMWILPRTAADISAPTREYSIQTLRINKLIT